MLWNKYNGSTETWTMACQDLGPYWHGKSLSSFSFSENLSQQEAASFFHTASKTQHVKLWTILHCRECFAETAWQDCQKDYLLISFVLGFISSNNGAKMVPSNEERIYSWLICGKIVFKSLIVHKFLEKTTLHWISDVYFPFKSVYYTMNCKHRTICSCNSLKPES